MPLRDRTTWLRGDAFHCLQPPAAFDRTWRLVLLGPPGAGKGTQANLLSGVLGACALSTGDVFRSTGERAGAAAMMAGALARMQHGQLISDDIVLQMVHDRRSCLRCEAGFLLDGFPRTLVQAIALDGLLAAERVALDAVLHYVVPSDVLVARLSGRRVCVRCHAAFHVTHQPPATEGVCDYCGGRVAQRRDDEPEAVRAQLAAYNEATALVATHYERQGLVLTIAATDAPERVFGRTLDALASRGFPVPRLSTEANEKS